MKSIKKPVQNLFLTLILLVFAVYILKNRHEVVHIFQNINFFWLPFVILCLYVNILIKSFLWAFLTRRMGCTLSYLKLVTIWHCSLIGSYIPGSVWLFIGRLHLLNLSNVPKKISIYSLFLEQIFDLSASIFIILLSPTLLSYIHIPPIAGVILTPLILLIFFPHLLGNLLWKMGLRRKDIKSIPKVPLHVLCIYFSGIFLNFYVLGIAMLFMLRLFEFNPPGINIFNITAFGRAGFVVGYLSLLTPNGIGVKEGILALLLSKYIPLTAAAIYAASGRLWGFLANGLVIIPSYFYLKKTGLIDREKNKQRTPEKKLRILFLVCGDDKKGLSPSARFRVYAYVSRFKRDPRFRIHIRPSFPSKYFFKSIFFKEHRILSKIIVPLGLLLMIFNRLIDIFIKSLFYDVIFIQKPLLPGRAFPFLETALSKLKNRNIVFDFDDAIFTSMVKDKKKNSILYDKRQIERIIRRAKLVVAGNDYLADFSKKFNPQTVVVPTPIDTETFPPRQKGSNSAEEIIIGWIGTSGNLPYLEALRPVFIRLQKKCSCTLEIICNPVSRELELGGVNYRWKTWSLEQEKDDLRGLDIGIMPLIDSAWAKGKCGFKLLQYMALEIPVVTSPVGVNSKIIQDGQNGFLASSDDDWYEKILKLVQSREVRSSFGKQGRETVEKLFSVKGTYPILTQAIQNIFMPSDEK